MLSRIKAVGEVDDGIKGFALLSNDKANGRSFRIRLAWENAHVHRSGFDGLNHRRRGPAEL